MKSFLITDSKTGNRAYVIGPKHCYVSADYLFSSTYEHLKFSSIIGAYIEVFYIVAPRFYLFIIPSIAEGHPMIAIDVMQLARIDHDIEFCGENVRIQVSNSGLIIHPPTN